MCRYYKKVLGYKEGLGYWVGILGSFVCILAVVWAVLAYGCKGIVF